MDAHAERRAEAAYAEFQRTHGPRAMAEVFDLTAGELLVFARRFAKDAAAAEDLVQQAFVRAIEREAQFDPSRRLLPWLMAIVANEARMAQRRGEPDIGRMRVREVVEPPEEAARREAQGALAEAFAKLSPEYRDVVAMRHLHDMRPRQIAAALAIPVGTVKTRLRRGVEKLAASLPPGLAFATVVSLLAGHGLAATRRAVLARAGAAAMATSVWSIWGGMTMKKLGLVVGVVLAWFATLPMWWEQAPAAFPAPTQGAVARAAAELGGAVAGAPGLGERAALPDAGQPLAVAQPAAVVAVELLVHAVWKASRAPAARVPLMLQAQGNDCLAQRWTDPAGDAHFAVSVPVRHWPDGNGERYLSVTTPLMPGRFFGLTITADPGRLVVELDDGQHVAGSVVDPAGDPVAGADVCLIWSSYPDAVVARSDASGAFELAGLAAGFALRASAGSKESRPATIADLVDGERLVLRLDRGGDQLLIRVAAQGQLVADAVVRVETDRYRTAHRRQWLRSTDADGEATFAGLPADSYVVEVLHRAHPPAQRRLTTEARDATRVETIDLAGSASLVGIVRRGGRPAPGVTVTFEAADSLFYGAGVSTDRDGRFTADSLAIGTHDLWFATDVVSTWRRVTLHEGEQTIEFDLPGGVNLEGRLLFPDGRPASRWTIAVQRTDEMAGNGRVTTDVDGRFACENLPKADYCLIASGPDGGDHRFFDVRTDGQAVDYRLPTTALWRPASITGRIENPLVGATLWRSDEHGNGGRGQPLAADGTFQLGPLAPGRHRIWIEQNDVMLWLCEVELDSAQAEDLGVVPLPRCGALVVALHPSAGIDPKQAHVLLRASAAIGGGSFGPRPQLGPDGLWHCERVPTGSWWIVVAGPGLAPDVREVFVQHDSTNRVEVDLSPAILVDLRFAVGGGGEDGVGWRRTTVRRAGDRAVVIFDERIGPLEQRLELASGSYTLDIETGGGFYGAAAFTVPAAATIEVPLARR